MDDRVIRQGLGKAAGTHCSCSVWDHWSQLLLYGNPLPSQLKRERRTFGKCLDSSCRVQTAPMITHSSVMPGLLGTLSLSKRFNAQKPLYLCTCQLCGPMSRLCFWNKFGWVFSYFQLKATQPINGHLVLLH